jgi:hypothetical protein
MVNGIGASNQIVEMHICNKDDWARFKQPRKSESRYSQELKDENVMFCLNKLDKEGKPIRKELYGKLPIYNSFSLVFLA